MASAPSSLSRRPPARQYSQNASLRRAARQALTSDECRTFKAALRAFRETSTAEQLVSDLQKLLDAPKKLDLLREIALLIPAGQRREFLRLAKRRFKGAALLLDETFIAAEFEHRFGRKWHGDVGIDGMDENGDVETVDDDDSDWWRAAGRRRDASISSSLGGSAEAGASGSDETDQRIISLKRSATIRRLNDDATAGRFIKLGSATFQVRYKSRMPLSLIAGECMEEAAGAATDSPLNERAPGTYPSTVTPPPFEPTCQTETARLESSSSGSSSSETSTSSSTATEATPDEDSTDECAKGEDGVEEVGDAADEDEADLVELMRQRFLPNSGYGYRSSRRQPMRQPQRLNETADDADDRNSDDELGYDEGRRGIRQKLQHFTKRHSTDSAGLATTFLSNAPRRSRPQASSREWSSQLSSEMVESTPLRPLGHSQMFDRDSQIHRRLLYAPTSLSTRLPADTRLSEDPASSMSSSVTLDDGFFLNAGRLRERIANLSGEFEARFLSPEPAESEESSDSACGEYRRIPATTHRGVQCDISASVDSIQNVEGQSTSAQNQQRLQSVQIQLPIQQQQQQQPPPPPVAIYFLPMPTATWMSAPVPQPAQLQPVAPRPSPASLLETQQPQPQPLAQSQPTSVRPGLDPQETWPATEASTELPTPNTSQRLSKPIRPLPVTGSRFPWSGSSGFYWPGLLQSSTAQAQTSSHRVRRVTLQRVNGVFGLSLVAREFDDEGRFSRFFVSSVATGSQAHRQDIQPGDEVLKLDDSRVDSMSLHELGLAIRSRNRMQLSLRTARVKSDSETSSELM